MLNNKSNSRGSSFGLNPIHHRWDTLQNIRLITFFNDTEVLGVVSEVEHQVQAYRAAWNASVKDSAPILESVKWVGKWGAFMDSFQPGPMDGYTQSRWDALPEPVRDAAEAQRITTAALEFIQIIKDRTVGLLVEKQVEARLGRLTVQSSGLISPLMSSK